MPKATLYSLFFLGLLQTSSLPAQTPAPTPAAERGTAIGTTVRAALDAAFPGASTLAGVLIDAAATRVKMNQTEKAAAKTAATEAASQTQAKLRQEVNAQIKALDTLATQLDVVTQFADASAAANEQIIPIISYLSTHNQPTAAEWTANVKSQWDVIQAGLKPLDVYINDPASLNKRVKDTYVNDLLHQILKAKQTKVVSLASLIKDTPQSENIPLIQQRLSELQPILSSISRVATLQVQTLAADLHDAATPEKEGGESAAEAERKNRVKAIENLLLEAKSND